MKEKGNFSENKIIKTRYKTTCNACSEPIERNQQVAWQFAEKKVTCLQCYDLSGKTGKLSEQNSDTPRHINSGVAGGSGEIEYLKRKEKYEKTIKENHPISGKLILLLNEEPQRIQAWKKGYEGEKLLGDALDSLGEKYGYIVLHDRKIPKTRANIDHIIINSTGVWVIDAKNYKGEIKIESSGGWFSSEIKTLKVGKRNCMHLIEAMHKQKQIIQNILNTSSETKNLETEIHLLLGFVNGTFTRFQKTTEINGVHLNRFGVEKHLQKQGNISEESQEIIAKILAKALPAKTAMR
jgi:hypothetical protein